MPKTVAMSSSAHARRSASEARRAGLFSASPNRPKDNRSNSASPRTPHFRVDSVIALECRRSPEPTRTPDCGGNGVPGGTAMASTAAEATDTRAAAAADRGATSASNCAAPGAASATTTPSARQVSPASSATSQPAPSAARLRTAAGIQRRALRVINASSRTR